MSVKKTGSSFLSSGRSARTGESVNSYTYLPVSGSFLQEASMSGARLAGTECMSYCLTGPGSLCIHQ